MIYLVYRMKLSPYARQNMKRFWSWLEERESWFYRELPMVESVSWNYSVIGDVYVVESRAAFADEAAWGQYRAALAGLKSDDSWETERVSQEEWWEFLDTKIVCDPPVPIGFTRNGSE